jgi:hypothetical protein
MANSIPSIGRNHQRGERRNNNTPRNGHSDSSMGGSMGAHRRAGNHHTALSVTTFIPDEKSDRAGSPR